MAVIGLTGGIASGKSTVAQLLRDKGVPVIDADVAARAVVAPGTPGLAKLVQVFGDTILDAEGALNRASMRARIGSDPNAYAQLNAITHPAIRVWIGDKIAAELAQGHPRVVVEAALLVETGGYRMYPTLVVVSCEPETQLKRVMSRDQQPEDQARAFIATQLPLAAKEAVATYVIRNDAGLPELAQAVDTLWEEITQLDPK
ncbi:MAG: dephospho-CoA kinase [Rhodobacterales bacterium]|nr:dephospho-CoA kinase [Rhodobacterales bacterium]